MKRAASLFIVVTILSTVSGCVTSLSNKAKLLAATQECGEADRTAQNLKLYSHCVELQLGAMEAQEAAYERRQADVLVGLTKALEPPAR